MTKTIRLDGNEYNIKNDGLYTMVINQLPDGKIDIKEKRSKYQLGVYAVLVSQEYVGPNPSKKDKPYYYLAFNFLEGVVGNSNPNIRKTHGWRGTTNDSSLYAHGVVAINSIRRLKNGQIAVKVKKINY